MGDRDMETKRDEVSKATGQAKGERPCGCSSGVSARVCGRVWAGRVCGLGACGRVGRQRQVA